jgi:16S rRNA (uracil1498-N3)-methyltransferase
MTLFFESFPKETPMSLKRLLCPQLPKPHRPTVLAEGEAHHAVRVLRLRDGDTVEAMDGQGHAAPAVLRVLGDQVRLEFAGAAATSSAQVAAAPAADAVTPVVLEMAIIKGDAMEWVVEKCVELGVRQLAPLVTAHTVVQVKNKGPEAFRDRWQKIADQALKQCGRLERLEVLLPESLEERVARHALTPVTPRYWADESERERAPHLADTQPGSASEIRLLIGPEGGWSEAERQLLATAATRVGLGPLVLRAETAALLGCGLLTARWRLDKGRAPSEG